MKKIKRIFTLVLDDLMAVYPYLVLFYGISLGATFYFKDWTHFFYWSGFTGIIVVLAIIFIVREWKGKRRRAWQKYEKRMISTQTVTQAITRIFDQTFRSVIMVLKRIRTRDFVKAGIIFSLLVYLGMQDIGLLNLLISLYALIVVFFGHGIRVSALLAFLLLMVCPVLLWLHSSDQITMNAAVYAYYFLIICLIGQIRVYLSTYLA